MGECSAKAKAKAVLQQQCPLLGCLLHETGAAGILSQMLGGSMNLDT